MWEFVDKFVYINLDHREDRRKIMNVFFEKGNIPVEKIQRFSAIRDNPGIIGSARSHIAVIKLAKENNWNRVLVLEDDLKWVNFEENYKKLEELVSEPDWDVCLLGGDYVRKTLPNKIHIALHTSCYLVNQHYYDTLLSNFETGLEKKLKTVPKHLNFVFSKQDRIHYLKNNHHYLNIDVYWMKLQLKDNWIGMIDPICLQVDSYSDNANSTIIQNKQKIFFEDWFNSMEVLFTNNLI